MSKVLSYSLFTDYDISLFAAGKHFRLYEKFGSHLVEHEGIRGVYFSVYAPAARSVRVIGDFNHWNGEEHSLHVRWDSSGIWEGFIPGLSKGSLYKYQILSNYDDKVREKSDPYARKYEMPPKTASIVWDTDFKWSDGPWMNKRVHLNALDQPMCIYECHIGSWRKSEEGYSLSYKEMAMELGDYLKDMSYTHVEFLPIMEHPFYPSWGYLSTGYFAPSSRYGDPEDFMYLVNYLHELNIGVILDWVPAHFPSDEFALADFDGSAVYEHPDKAKGFHPDWNSLIFNYERPQVRAFLISSAHFWLDKFNVDGLRVDAVASMLYLDYSRDDGEWSCNEYGGNEYLAAISLLKELNVSVYKEFPGIQMIAEESTAFNGVTRPVHEGGLGFGLKWMMGWMNDTLEYFQRDPIHRKYHHNDISRSLTYAFSENYILPLSHDEVVHGKQSIVHKMPGDDWQRIANVRLLYAYMYTHPGQNLLFMGNDIAQTSEWSVNGSVEWHLLDYAPHQGVQNLVRDLNNLYCSRAALFEKNYESEGFEWIDYNDSDNSVLAYLRKAKNEQVLVVANFTPTVLSNYRIGVPSMGQYFEIFNSDLEKYGGTGIMNSEILSSENPSHGRAQSIDLSIGPLACIILKNER
jgi:1,4-alpha-glucan branching enzyme